MFTSRREFLTRTCNGIGAMALAGMLSEELRAAPVDINPMALKAPHLRRKAKNCIFLFMAGGASQIDTFDYKPKLTADTGAPAIRPGTKLLGSKWKFAQHGQSGLWISELFPNVANHADEAFI